MTEKEMRRLSRGDLLEIMVKQGEMIESLQAELAKAKEALNCRDIDVENAGSIAEASLKLNGIFQSAEDAAKQYLENIEKLQARQEEQCAKIEAESREEADRIIRDAKNESVIIIERARLESLSYWESVREKMEQLIESNTALQRVLYTGSENDGSTKQNGWNPGCAVTKARIEKDQTQ